MYAVSYVFQRFQPCWNHSKAFHAIQCQNVGYIIDIWGILGHYLVFYYESNWESSVKALVVCCATYGGSGNIASRWPWHKTLFLTFQTCLWVLKSCQNSMGFVIHLHNIILKNITVLWKVHVVDVEVPSWLACSFQRFPINPQTPFAFWTLYLAKSWLTFFCHVPMSRVVDGELLLVAIVCLLESRQSVTPIVCP